MIAFGIFALIFIVFAGVEPAYLTEARGMSIDAAGRAVALTTLIAIPGSFIAGGLVRRGVSPMRLAQIGFIIPAILSVAIFLPDTSLPIVIGATAIAMITGALIPAAVYTR